MDITKIDAMVPGFEAELTTKYLYYTNFYGAFAYGMRTNRFTYRHLEEAVEAFKTAICNVYHGGCEPEFETEETYRKWEAFNKDAFLLVTEAELKKYFFDTRNSGGWLHKPEDVNLKNYHAESPYVMKKIPYYIGVDKNYGEAPLTLEQWKAWKYSATAKKFGV